MVFSWRVGIACLVSDMHGEVGRHPYGEVGRLPSGWAPAPKPPPTSNHQQISSVLLRSRGLPLLGLSLSRHRKRRLKANAR